MRYPIVALGLALAGSSLALLAPAAQTPELATVTGCLQAEKDVPGGKPNLAERAGITEDFILTHASVGDGKTAGGRSDGALPERRFKVEGLDKAKARAHLDKQVEIRGRLAVTATPLVPARPPAYPRREVAPDEVQAIRAVSIREIAATCTKPPR